jgi:hypothetical protein
MLTCQAAKFNRNPFIRSPIKGRVKMIRITFKKQSISDVEEISIKH